MISAALCVALTIYYESRFEPEIGQYAVASVIENRARKSGKTECQIVFAPRQFSWANSITNHRDTIGNFIPPRTDPRWQRSLQIARVVMANRNYDFANGATFYHAIYVHPYWALDKTYIMQCGNHRFYK
jgi:spore germination cell wall hydrolase CwlJ-like protein